MPYLLPGTDRHSSRFRSVLLSGICMLASVAMLACSDDAAEPLPAPAPEAASDIPLTQRQWLDSTDAIRPEVWLASRLSNRAASEATPSLEQLAALLEAASRQFHDPPRMIANRAVQLEGMLAELGGTEQAPELIEILARVIDGSDAREGFGAVCQHYYNLRASGLGQDQTLTDLKRRYGARQ